MKLDVTKWKDTLKREKTETGTKKSVTNVEKKWQTQD